MSGLRNWFFQTYFEQYFEQYFEPFQFLRHSLCSNTICDGHWTVIGQLLDSHWTVIGQSLDSHWTRSFKNCQYLGHIPKEVYDFKILKSQCVWKTLENILLLLGESSIGNTEPHFFKINLNLLTQTQAAQCNAIRVSNGTGQCNFSGQRERSSFIFPGQRDNGTSSKSCQGTGRAGTVCQSPGRDTGQNNHYFSVKIRDGTGTGRDNRYFFPMISCFTSFPVLEILFLFYNILSCIRMSFSCFRTSFSCFLVKLFCPGTSWNRGVCPGILSPALVPVHRDSETRKYFGPGTKG